MDKKYYSEYLRKLTKIVDLVKEHGEVLNCINSSDYTIDQNGYINFDKYIREINYMKLAQYDEVKTMADELKDYLLENNPEIKALPFNHPHFLEFAKIVTIIKNIAHRSLKIDLNSNKNIALTQIKKIDADDNELSEIDEHYKKYYPYIKKSYDPSFIYYKINSQKLLELIGESTVTYRVFTGHAYRLYCRGIEQMRIRYGYMICCEKPKIVEETARVSPPNKLKNIEHDLLKYITCEIMKKIKPT